MIHLEISLLNNNNQFQTIKSWSLNRNWIPKKISSESWRLRSMSWADRTTIWQEPRLVWPKRTTTSITRFKTSTGATLTSPRQRASSSSRLMTSRTDSMRRPGSVSFAILNNLNTFICNNSSSYLFVAIY